MVFGKNKWIPHGEPIVGDGKIFQVEFNPALNHYRYVTVPSSTEYDEVMDSVKHKLNRRKDFR